MQKQEAHKGEEITSLKLSALENTVIRLTIPKISLHYFNIVNGFLTDRKLEMFPMRFVCFLTVPGFLYAATDSADRNVIKNKTKHEL